MRKEELYRVCRLVDGRPITMSGTIRGVTSICLSSRPRGYDGETPPWADKAFLQLGEYFTGRRQKFELPLEKPHGTPFQKQVWDACRRIPYGSVVSYGELARRLGRPDAARAVGQALGRNPLPLVIPCHRVVPSGGGLGGFSCGIAWKQRLLRLEKTGSRSARRR